MNMAKPKTTSSTSAADIMVAETMTVRPETPVREIAELLLRRHISAVPVVDAEGGLLGLVSEGDLLRRVEIGTVRRRPWWLAALTDDATLANEYAKAHGLTAAQVMSRPVISIEPATPLSEVVALMETNRVKRLPVVQKGHLVGVVSRADLLQALLKTEDAPDTLAADQAAKAALVAKLKGERWSWATEGNIEVIDGVAHVWGLIGSEEQRRALAVAATTTPGVRKMVDHTRLSILSAWDAAMP